LFQNQYLILLIYSLLSSAEVVFFPVDPVSGGECVLNVIMTVSPAGSIMVVAGEQFSIPGNLVIQQQAVCK
jgi:hypothetical protein